jgi:hypothetical protein
MKFDKAAGDAYYGVNNNRPTFFSSDDVFKVLFHKIQKISFGCSLEDQKELLLFTGLDLIGGQVDCAGLINVECGNAMKSHGTGHGPFQSAECDVQLTNPG